MEDFKSGFVNIFGMPNAGKSTLMNHLVGQKLAITSPKVQTTRHRILGILSEPTFQIVFSDTPGIISPKYKLHQKMMQQVSGALQDADVGIIVHDIHNGVEPLNEVAALLKIKVPILLALNKIDIAPKDGGIDELLSPYKQAFPDWEIWPISAIAGDGVAALKKRIVSLLPSGPAFYPDEEMSDRPTRFFVSELIREQIYAQYHEEIPYHAAVIIQEYTEKPNITIIKAEIIVSRDTQKMILLGKGGSQIKKLGIESRLKIEELLEAKVHLELFIKVRPKWRDNENYLKEYGYNA